ncbi:MAG: Gfo/Idh/MocA family oxidoreductase [Acidobacteriota bacterium]|nr:Gfo/Idh/MocA family oxidoreductase [Acidobacteriota bacterium]
MSKEFAANSAVRVAVAGAGAFGQNHLRVYRELETAGAGVQLVAAVEPDAARAAECSAKFGIPVFSTTNELLRSNVKVDAASVAVPTVYHHATAAELLDSGLDVLVEKPIAASLSQADELIAHAEAKKCILQPGHLERFNPAVLAVEPNLRRPMFFEAHRLSVFTPRSLDVDVVLDLMIHDLDIVLTFAHSPVREVRAVGLPILSPKVDIANVRVEFESGCVANFTASRVSTERVRKLRFFEPRQYVSIDYARRDVLVIRVDENGNGMKPADLIAALPEGVRAMLPKHIVDGLNSGAIDLKTLDPKVVSQFASMAKIDPAVIAQLTGQSEAKAGLSFSKPEIQSGEPLKLEIESFLESVRTRRTPHVTAQQGRNALALALEIQARMAAHAERAGLQSFFETGA